MIWILHLVYAKTFEELIPELQVQRRISDLWQGYG